MDGGSRPGGDRRPGAREAASGPAPAGQADDDYVSLSYRNAPGARPAQIITAITRALAAVSGPP